MVWVGEAFAPSMADSGRFRWPTIGVTGACLVLSGFAVWWNFQAYVEYRSKDFTKVSEGPVFGTCVEAVTDDMLKTARYDKANWDCSDSSKEDLGNLLAAQIHPMYWADSQGRLDGEGKRVLESLISTTQGTAGHQITKTQAYNALKSLGTPNVDCAAIYQGGSETTPPTPVAPAVVCDGVAATNGTALATVSLDALYTHCVIQFSYARSYPKDGTFSVPAFGKEPKPRLIPLIINNSSATWYDEARIVTGTRWGYATPVYVLFVLTTAFFLMDCTVFLLAELTRVRTRHGRSHSIASPWHLPDRRSSPLPPSVCRSTPTLRRTPSPRATLRR